MLTLRDTGWGIFLYFLCSFSVNIKLFQNKKSFKKKVNGTKRMGIFQISKSRSDVFLPGCNLRVLFFWLRGLDCVWEILNGLTWCCPLSDHLKYISEILESSLVKGLRLPQGSEGPLGTSTCQCPAVLGGSRLRQATGDCLFLDFGFR